MSEKSQAHKAAFDDLKLYLEDTLVESEGAELLTSLHQHYMTKLEDDESKYSAQTLCEKILKEFPTLQKTKKSNKSGIVIYSHSLTAEAAIRRATFDEHNLKETAFYLRSLIIATMSEHNELPNPLTAEALAKGQTDTPEPLLQFFRLVFSGSKTPTEHIERQAKAVSDDVVFITSRG